MIKVLLGTTSTQKIEIVKIFFKAKKIKVVIIPVKVNSDINNQPLSEMETTKGSVNRARTAINGRQKEEFDFGLGLEGGLQLFDNLYHLVCVATIVDKNNHVYFGISKKISLPIEVSEEVKKGGEFGILIREYEKNENNNTKSDQEYISELINRTNSFLEALNIAYIKYQGS